jgi:uncharacterized protein
MRERTSHPPGAFSWVDLSTNDTDRAKAFYAGLFGCEYEHPPVGEEGTDTICGLGGKDVAALARQSDQEREQGIC